MPKKIQFKRGEEGQKKSGCLGVLYPVRIRLILESIIKRSFIKRRIWQPLFNFCPSSPQKERFLHVTICRVSRRGLLCLVGLLASQVIANFTDIDSLHLQFITDDVNIIREYDDQILRILLGANQNQGITSSYNNDFSYNPFYKISNTSMINALNIIKQQMASPTYQNIVGNDYYATLYGLIAGWSPNSVPNVDGIPYGVETNGIFWYARDLSDALHNTNSVFHRQLTAQETLTNQLERLISQQSEFFTNVNYQLSPLLANSFGDDFNYRYFDELVQSGSFPWDGSENLGFLYNLGAGLVFSQTFKVPASLYSPSSYNFLSSMGLSAQYSPWDYVSQDIYSYYGTKWGFDSITNILLSQDFDFNSISVVKPEVDDMVQDSTEEVQDSLPSTPEEQEGVKPGDYEEIQDSRIDTSFLQEAQQHVTSIKFTENLFDDFKSHYNGLFKFDTPSSIQYSFTLNLSQTQNITVNDTDLLGSASDTLSRVKPTIDSILKVIIGLNKFICLIVFFGLAFKMVSEVLSS